MKSFWAYIYLNLAVGRTAHILWEIKKLSDRIRKNRKKLKGGKKLGSPARSS